MWHCSSYKWTNLENIFFKVHVYKLCLVSSHVLIMKVYLLQYKNSFINWRWIWFFQVGSKHEELEKVVRLLPYIQHKGDKVTMSEALDPANLLPRGSAYWMYPGSLTTPPCTESVTWILFKQPVEVSAEQVIFVTNIPYLFSH